MVAQRPGPVTIATLDGQPLKADFPLYTSVFGVNAVVISVDEYRQLLGTRIAKGFEGPLKAFREARHPPPPRPSTIERDPEVAGFLRERFKERLTAEKAHAAALEHFGPERAPSRGRVATFLHKILRGA